MLDFQNVNAQFENFKTHLVFWTETSYCTVALKLNEGVVWKECTKSTSKCVSFRNCKISSNCFPRLLHF